MTPAPVGDLISLGLGSHPRPGFRSPCGFATRTRWYALAGGLFLLALGTKTVTATLPAALLVVFWWQRGALSWRRDVMPLVPFLLVGAASGLFTAWVESNLIGASGPDYSLTTVERGLVAGRAVWFYAGKLFWPAELMFNYPRWALDANAVRAYVFPLSLLATLIALWGLLRRSRGPLAGALVFIEPFSRCWVSSIFSPSHFPMSRITSSTWPPWA